MKVAVMTKAVPFGEEAYVDVKANKKLAEKSFREMYPHMRNQDGGLVSDATNSLLLFIHEVEV